VASTPWIFKFSYEFFNDRLSYFSIKTVVYLIL
jgi:hypothetical protein